MALPPSSLGRPLFLLSCAGILAACGSPDAPLGSAGSAGQAAAGEPSVAGAGAGTSAAGGAVNVGGTSAAAGGAAGNAVNANGGVGGATGGQAAAGASGSGGTGAISYATTFDLDETPLSEGGAWRQLGLDWTSVVTAGGVARGTQAGSGGFNDSYAYLSATYPANQSASGVIHLEAGIAAAYAEVEILLRWTDSAHDSTGYECNLAFTGQYAEIIKWPGPLGTQKSQFTFISSGNPVAGGVHDGDVFQADVIGNVITARLNGKVIATGTDSSIANGSPGIGFYTEGAPASAKFSFSQFSATGL